MLPREIIIHFSKLSKSNRKIKNFCNSKWWYNDIFSNCKCKQICKYDLYSKTKWKNHMNKSVFQIKESK